jgi:hypothetical protein
MGVVKVVRGLRWGWVGGEGYYYMHGYGLGWVGKTVESYFTLLSLLKLKELKIFQQGSNVRNSTEVRQNFIIIFALCFSYPCNVGQCNWHFSLYVQVKTLDDNVKF